MRTTWIVSFLLVFLTISAAQVGAEDVVIRERLARLEEGQKALRELTDKRFDDMNRRFDDMNDSINRRFDDINRRFDDLRFWLQIILGALVVIIGAFVAQWFLMWKRIIGVESLVANRATEVDQVLADQKEQITEVNRVFANQKKEPAKADRAFVDQRQEIEELRMRLGALEAKLAG